MPSLVLRRAGYKKSQICRAVDQLPGSLADAISFSVVEEITPHSISSSWIRENLSESIDKEYICHAAGKYITDHGLYSV